MRSQHQAHDNHCKEILFVAQVWLEQPQFHFQQHTENAVFYSSVSFTARQRLERSRAFSKWKMKLQPAEEQHCSRSSPDVLKCDLEATNKPCQSFKNHFSPLLQKKIHTTYSYKRPSHRLESEGGEEYQVYSVVIEKPEPVGCREAVAKREDKPDWTCCLIPPASSSPSSCLPSPARTPAPAWLQICIGVFFM